MSMKIIGTTMITFRITDAVNKGYGRGRIDTEIGWVMHPGETYEVYRLEGEYDWFVSKVLRSNGEVNGSLKAHNKTEKLRFTSAELRDAYASRYLKIISKKVITP